MNLKSNSQGESLNASNVKCIIVEAEDTRIASRMSELSAEIKDPNLLSKRIKNLNDLRLNLESGEQCVRDFFLCISENSFCWPDVDSCFSLSTTHSVTCKSCKFVHESESKLPYVELDVPSEGSLLKSSIEKFFNSPNVVDSTCDFCKSNVQVEVRNQIFSIEETNFITVLLRRAIDTAEGLKINTEKIISTSDVFLK